MSHIAIIGAGYVGGALNHYLQQRGIHAALFDPAKGHTDAGVLADAEIIFVCVPTPFYLNGQGFDDSYIRTAISAIPGEGKIIVIKSTLQPGTTERLQAAFPQHRLLCNPEFLTEDRAEHDMQFPNRQLVGYTAQSRNDAEAIMALLPRAPFERILSATAAETVKCATNAFYALKVTYANQLYDVCEQSGIDYEEIKPCIQAEPWMGGDMHWEVVHRGYRGYGGKCIPKDTRMFIQRAEQVGARIPLLEHAEQYNNTLTRAQGLDIRWEAGSPQKEQAEESSASAPATVDGFWAQLMHGKTPVRALMNASLAASAPWHGRILDIGGTTKPRPSYRNALRLADGASVHTVNIDAASHPDIIADAARLPIEDVSIDAAWCLNLLEHVEDPRAVMAEAARVLKPGARLALFTPFFVRVHGHPEDYQRFTDTALTRLAVNAGFQVESVSPMGGGPFLAAAAQVQPILPRLLSIPLVALAQLCDAALYALRPSLGKHWPLGYLLLAKKG